jgi:hypothetical protein
MARCRSSRRHPGGWGAAVSDLPEFIIICAAGYRPTWTAFPHRLLLLPNPMTEKTALTAAVTAPCFLLIGRNHPGKRESGAAHAGQAIFDVVKLLTAAVQS